MSITEPSSPVFIPQVFNEEHYAILRNRLEPIARTLPYNEMLGRYHTTESPQDILMEFARLYLFNAMWIFDSDTLRPTYAAFGHYEARDGHFPALPPHRDTHACTYTIDICLYQNAPWDIVIEGENYSLLENQAVAFQSCDLRHWRPPFPHGENGYVGMVFLHYAEPDHWFFTKGADYFRVVNGEITEEEWLETR